MNAGAKLQAPTLVAVIVLIATMATSYGPSRAAAAFTPTSTSNQVAAQQTTTSGDLSFSNDQLIVPEGDSEPAISMGTNGVMAITALRWTEFGTNLWTGPAGSTPTYQHVIDASLQPHGHRVGLGGGDADVDVGSTGTLHETSLIFVVNPPFIAATLGVAAITCPDVASFDLSTCASQIVDTAGADRPWITSEAAHVYLSYHDARNGALIRLQRSDDDGYSWQKVGNPIVGQGRVTANATFNNTAGPIVADPLTHNVYAIYTAGEPGIQKAKSANHNNVYVSRSTDFGRTWIPALVFHAPLFTRLDNDLPYLAIDPTNGKLYATWSDGQKVYFSASSDQGVTWSAAVTVNVAPANTAIYPGVAAYNGAVDVVYYGTPSGNNSSAVWNVYLAQTTNDGASFAQSPVSNTPNHHGVICTTGVSCTSPLDTRTLLDLFELSINPQTGLVSVVYTDDMLTTVTLSGSVHPLPQIVLAQQKP